MIDFLNDVLRIAAHIQADVNEHSRPPPQGNEPKTNQVLDLALFRPIHTRLIPIVKQINGTYENGWYDACATMLRRLIETLIIEVFVAKQIGEEIKRDGEFLQLSELIEKACQETRLKLSRNSKKTLRAIAKLGNSAAHERVITLRRESLEMRLVDIQLLVQHLIEI